MKNLILLEPGRSKGIRDIPWDLLDGLDGDDVVHKLKVKELLEFECKKLQIRQVGVNEDPHDPMLAGAWYELAELLLVAYDFFWMLWFSQDVFWSELIGLVVIKPQDCPIFP